MKAWTQWLSSAGFAPMPPAPPATRDIRDLRERILDVLHDCEGPVCDRMRRQLAAARSAHDLWHARTDVFYLVAQQHCEAQAVARINALVPSFEGWLPARMLRTL